MNKKWPKRVGYLIVSIWLLSVFGQASTQSSSIGGDFELVSHLGKPFSLHDIKGKVGVLFFGFTHCPDVCPNTLLEIQRLLVTLGEQAEQVSVLFISVDPKRDTPEKLESYVKYFNKNFIGLTGSTEAIDGVLKQYNASVSFAGDTNSDHYNIGSMLNIYLID